LRRCSGLGFGPRCHCPRRTGRCAPVAWYVLAANQPGAWMPHLVHLSRPAVPRTVVGRRSRLCLDGPGSRLSRPSGAPRGDADASVGGRPGATRGHVDQCAARAHGLVLIQVAGVNRVGLPDPQRGGLVVGAELAYRTYPPGPPLAGAGVRHPHRRCRPPGGAAGRAVDPAARPCLWPPVRLVTPQNVPTACN
jgi:hypothetical protein